MKTRFLVFVSILALGGLALAFAAGPAAAHMLMHGGHGMAAPAQISRPAAGARTIQFGGLLGLVYSPADVVIAPGDTVTWQGDFLTHPLVSDEAQWVTVESGAEFSHTFTQPGLYHFHCRVHGALFNMRGTVLVAYRDYMPFTRK